MFQYAVSDGEGTLIGYGIVSANDLINGALVWAMVYTFICEPCARDCETGK